MLHLIIGRIGAGKTEAMYAKIAELLREGKSVPVVIVPEQYSFETEKNMLHRLGTVQADAVGVYSFTFLAKLLLKELGAAADTMLDDATRAMLMALALEALDDQLEFYGKSKYSAGFITDLLGMIKELRQCAVSPQILRQRAQTMEDGTLKSKITELSLIEQAYTAMAACEFDDSETALDLLHDRIAESDWLHGKTVLIDGFRGFTWQEMHIIEDLLRQADDVYVTLCTDSVRGLYEKHSVFAHTRRTAAKLLQSNDKVCGVPAEIMVTEYPQRYHDRFLAALEENLYALTPRRVSGEPDIITVCAAENFMAECDFVAANIRRLLATGKYRCRDIAVIARDAATYERQIKAALKKYGVPVYIDKRQPIRTQPLIAFADAALDIAANGFSTESIMRLLKTGLTGLEEEQIAQLENYALLWQVRGARWCSPFKGHPGGFGAQMREADAALLAQINETRQTVTVPLSRLRESLRDASGADAVEAVYRMLLAFGVDAHLKTLAQQLSSQGEQALAEEQDRVWGLLMQTLDALAAALGQKKVSAKRLCELFRLMISCCTMGALPVGLDEITVGAADRIQISSPKIVFAVGVNDGVFPYVQPEQKILSRAERTTLKSYGISLSQSAEEDVMEERYIAYNTLCSATEQLFVTYTKKTLTGVEIAPSELVLQIQKIFPDLRVVQTAALPDTAWIGSEAAAFEMLAKKYRDNSSLSATLQAYFETDSTAKGKLTALRRAAQRKPFVLEDTETALKLFGKHMYISATRAETYYKCPFSYFCKFGIRIYPLKTAQLDPMQKGTIIHFVLEHLLRDYPADVLKTMSAEAIDDAVLTILQSYFELNMSAEETQSERFRLLYNDLGTTVCAIAQRMLREFAVSEFIPVDFELPIDKDGEVQPLQVPLASGGTLQLRGSVDRVDMMRTQDTAFVRVVDYKLSGKTFRLSDVFYGLNMQMLIYLFSIWKNGTGKYSDTMPAGVLYMPAKATAADLGRDASPEQVLKQQLADCRMNGLVLEDSRAIVGMDRELSGMVIPVKFDEKTNSFKGSLLDFTGFATLYEMVIDRLKNMGDCLQAGKIEALPVYSQSSTSAYTDACKYCDYKSVCGFEKNDPRKEIITRKDADCLAAWKGDDANADIYTGTTAGD